MASERTRHVCIRVPKPGDEHRKEYTKCGSREAWVRHCLGKDGVYVGRPANDGGWYQSSTVKAGSIFANPFPVGEYPLQESLQRYYEFLRARLASGASARSLIELLPTRLQVGAERRFAGGAENPAVGKSIAHLRLGIVGKDFRLKLLELSGKRLGCFCDESAPCHAKVLAAQVEKERRAGAGVLPQPAGQRQRGVVAVEEPAAKRKRSKAPLPEMRGG